MPTTSFPETADADDGWCDKFLVGAWGDLSASGSFENNDGSNVIGVAKKLVFGTRFQVDCAFMRFDTSSLDDSATITAASLRIRPTTISETVDDVEYAADFYDFGGQPSVAGDWELTSSGDAISLIDPDSLTSGAYNNISLTGLSGINKSGYTGIRIAPLDSTQPTGDNFMEFVNAANVSFDPPTLEVTYTVPFDSRMAKSQFPKPKLRTVR